METIDFGFLRGLITLVVFSAFMGLVFWAYSSRRREDFEALAQLPLENDRVIRADEIDVEGATS